ncbi:MAG: YitT family protein [Desulfatibacillaceae bacterium]|nr:YitT family protein [Desulfatibacillaceae bacterium]
MKIKTSELSYRVSYNLSLITIGSIISVLPLKGIAVHEEFVTGGIFGLALMIHYAGVNLSPGILFAVLNIPLAVLGWFSVGRRFILYTIYAMAVATLAYELLDVNFGIENPVYASMACGGIMGFGLGLVLRTLGSNGGVDILAVVLNQKYNIGIGKTYFLFNLALFAASATFLAPDTVIASVFTVLIGSMAINYVLALFSNRKLVMIISTKYHAIVEDIMVSLNQGATILHGKGSYSGQDKPVVMTITNNVMLKRLEELVFTHDPAAIFIVENTFNVIGTGFSKRKLY